ncbi:unnamed protein product, partial [Amoebophrya sp. A25]
MYNFCDSVDGEASDVFLHRIGVLLEEKWTPLRRLEEWYKSQEGKGKTVDASLTSSAARASFSCGEADTEDLTCSPELQQKQAELAAIREHSIDGKHRVSGLAIFRYLIDSP